MEENLEKRIQVLEKKCRVLTQSSFILLFFVAYAVFSGSLSAYRDAMAQLDNDQEVSTQRRRIRRARRTRKEVKKEDEVAKTVSKKKSDPQVVEGEIFILKDSQGNIRGVWSADDETTSFAMTYKENHPIIGMAVDQANATMTLTDSRQGKIALSLADSIRSISITDDTEKNNVYMGLTGSGDASFDMVSTKSSSMVIDGTVSRIDLTGDKAIVALAETVGSTVALQSAPSTAGLTFVDFKNNPTMKLSTVDGVSEIEFASTAKDEVKRFTTAPSLPEKAKEEVKKDEKKNVEEKVDGAKDDKTTNNENKNVENTEKKDDKTQPAEKEKTDTDKKE